MKAPLERVAAPTAPPTIELCGQPLHALDEAQCVAHVLAALAAGQGGWIVTPNLDHLRRLVHDEEFARLCAGATLRVADGRPLVWASRLRGTPLPGVVAGSNLIHSLSAGLAVAGRSAFFLGGNPGTAQATAELLAARHAGLVVAGWSAAPPGFEVDARFMRDLLAQFERSEPDVVWVALGSPKQERLIAELRSRLPRAWWLGVGISFSFVSGEVRRAPRWMQRSGLEWLHRLAQEPGRLARRYLVDGVPFAARLFLRSWRERSAATRGSS